MSVAMWMPRPALAGPRRRHRARRDRRAGHRPDPASPVTARSDLPPAAVPALVARLPDGVPGVASVRRMQPLRSSPPLCSGSWRPPSSPRSPPGFEPGIEQQGRGPHAAVARPHRDGQAHPVHWLSRLSRLSRLPAAACPHVGGAIGCAGVKGVAAPLHCAPPLWYLGRGPCRKPDTNNENSFVPATAPLAMPNRIAVGAVVWCEPLVAVTLTVAAIAGLLPGLARPLPARHAGRGGGGAARSRAGGRGPDREPPHAGRAAGPGLRRAGAAGVEHRPPGGRHRGTGPAVARRPRPTENPGGGHQRPVAGGGSGPTGGLRRAALPRALRGAAVVLPGVARRTLPARHRGRRRRRRRPLRCPWPRS